MALAREMVALAERHKRIQDAERRAAGDAWGDHNLVWCQPNGVPIDASADWAEWKAILREAQVRDARVHDGRHTAATMLLLLGVDEQTVMAIMGWSDRRMLGRYQHVIDELRAAAAQGIGGLLWGKPKKKQKEQPKQEISTSGDGCAGRPGTKSGTKGHDAKII